VSSVALQSTRTIERATPWVASLLAHGLALVLWVNSAPSVPARPLIVSMAVTPPAAEAAPSPSAPPHTPTQAAPRAAQPKPNPASSEAPQVISAPAQASEAGSPVVAPVPSTSPAAAPSTTPTAQAEAPGKPLADSGWLSKTLTQLMNERKQYPRMAQRMGMEGVVMIEAVLDEEGRLLSAQVQQSSGHALLDKSALALMKSVMPVNLEGRRIAANSKVVIPVRYALQ